MTDTGVPEPLLPAARALFSEYLPLAERYAGLLGTEGVLRGLIGPRETPRLWDRHLLNCAVITPLIEKGSMVTDVGSGAGLPGIVLAVARVDLTVVLVEPLARRVGFLTEVVAELGLSHRVRVVRARAEEVVTAPGDGVPRGGTAVAPAGVVTARAVAPLDRLAAWCLPLATMGGRMLAIKGASAADEVAEHQHAITELGGGAAVVRRCGAGLLDQPATVVEIVRERLVAERKRSSQPPDKPQRRRAPAGRRR